ncbi:MAG TPA: O-methyltransferase [Candidatus Sulfotelmatobacter sp.]|nr:O-methyltransferase [Candidatus Sulfotelmatobacter sp.]
MTKKLWTAVDQYINEMLIPNDPVLDAALRAAADAGLPQIQVSPPQGKLLHVLVRSLGARRILEIGTLGGYSSIWMARALPPGGHLLTLEAEARHAEVARANFERAGLTHCIEVRLGPALDTLPRVAVEGRGPFDLLFIDANKSAITEYFDWALRLSRPGSLILVDNVIRDGEVIDAESDDPDVQGVRRFNVRLAQETRVSATEIQTVGSKGYDGFAMAVVLGQ